MVTNIKIRPVRSGDWLKFETLVAGICAFHGNKHGLTRSQFDDFATRENAPVTVLVAETEDSILAGFVQVSRIIVFRQAKQSSKFKIYMLPKNSDGNGLAKF